MQFTYRWNTVQRRKYDLEKDWGTFDLTLVISAFRAASLVLRVHGATEYLAVRRFSRRLECQEDFGLNRPHITLQLQTNAADQYLPVNTDLMHQIVASLSADLSLFTKAVKEAVINASENKTTSEATVADPAGVAIEQAAVTV